MPVDTSFRTLWLRYGIPVFLGAFLLFQVQPLLGQALLPRFGGTYAVWTVCLVFFQVLLLAGYAYAHVLSRLSPPRQSIVHAILVALSLVFLPITSMRLHTVAGAPAFQVLQILSVQVGLPYLILASTGPLLQSWLHRETRAVPYRFYALSNTASLLGLGTYPFLIQPWLGMTAQGAFWSVGYALFAVFLVVGAIVVARKMDTADLAGALALTLSGREAAFWVGLPAAASMLLLGITNELTSEIAAVPFLWVLPLGLYLVTFIIAFERPDGYNRKRLLPLFVLCLLANTPLIDALNLRWKLLLPVASATLFLGALSCHGELVRLRPDPRRLTTFYLCIAAGGALGGILVGVVAPVIFSGYWEVPLGLIAALVLILAAARRDPTSALRRRRGWAWPAWIGVTVLLAALLCAVPVLVLQSVDAELRNFYGVLHVVTVGEGSQKQRVLMHGSTIHGAEFIEPARSRMPTTYYGPGSGVALAIERHPRREVGALRVAGVGLGVGTIAAWARPGDVVRYYEINPAVVEAAQTRFGFLASSEGQIQVVIGDGRLLLEHDPPESTSFDVLALDAFAGGAIPAHLLTRESFALYRRSIKPDGIIAVHVSNEFLRLAPAVRAAANALGLPAVLVVQDANPEQGLEPNQWVLVTGDQTFLNAIANRVTPWGPGDAPHLLTDEKMSVLPLLRH
jgi:hypothetical protein